MNHLLGYMIYRLLRRQHYAYKPDSLDVIVSRMMLGVFCMGLVTLLTLVFMVLRTIL